MLSFQDFAVLKHGSGFKSITAFEARAFGVNYPTVNGWYASCKNNTASKEDLLILYRTVLEKYKIYESAEKTLAVLEYLYKQDADFQSIKKVTTTTAQGTKVKTNKFTKPSVDTDAFLYSRAWGQMRQRVIQQYGAQCMACGVLPSGGVTINVDHIKSRKNNPELALDFNNLQILCELCNKKKGNKDETDYRNNRAYH